MSVPLVPCPGIYGRLPPRVMGGDARRMAAQRQALLQVDGELREATQRLREAFPQYAELAAPAPIEVPAVQVLLRPDEALVRWFTLPDRVMVWLVRPGQALYLGERATKPMVQALNAAGRLGQAQVLAFATHALLAGELTGLRQPALVLTPPATASDRDDGLLALEDILGLKLPHTSWVILSACNTAADDGSGEGLSGLARAFFYAGAASLLVSQWSVDDVATRVLMTEVFRRQPHPPVLTRAEALRQGMLAVMKRAQGRTAYFAHPCAWAPFMLVGEGGLGRP